MTDYGHDLLFGSFLTPSNADPDGVVELAQLSEEVELDLVTFQDHPYQPRFLDTWTLLSWGAARTSRIRLAPNVINVPLRPPAVLARAAASLDLLSGGRCELALGAGGFWDAIEAMGGRRLTPGQSVEALRRQSRSFGASGMQIIGNDSPWPVNTTAWTAPSAVLTQRTRWGSGWVPISHACCG